MLHCQERPRTLQGIHSRDFGTGEKSTFGLEICVMSFHKPHTIWQTVRLQMVCCFDSQLLKRECARKAFVEAENSDKPRRAFLRRQRPHRGHHAGGTFVMFWRPGRGEHPGQWHGPARVIIHESNHVIWISHSSRVYRVAPEHVRSLSEREANQCQSQLEIGPMELPAKDKGKGVFQYEDLTELINQIPMPASPVNPSQVDANPNAENSEQPDAEPSNFPSQPPSSLYTPTTPLSQNPDETVFEPPVDPNPSTEVPTEPKDIPVPEDDELMTEDYWLTQGDKILRVHQTPRTSAFDPCCVTDCPVDILQVCSSRVTTGNYHGQPLWMHEDSWGTNDSTWKTQHPWTGVSIFHVLDLQDINPDSEPEDIMHLEETQGFEYEVFLTQEDVDHTLSDPCSFPAFVAAAAKRQRTEVKLRDLSQEQLREFQQAKNKELDQWLATETVRKILRHKIPDQNILRRRWVLTWKELDAIDAKKEGSSRRAKARLVILGYEDPDITNIPRDSPTLQKESRSLLLQLSASRRWQIKSFDIKTAFLRGSRRDNRILGIEPPEELRAKLKMRPDEICELLKSAYGLVNAPYLWYQELKESLLQLNFVMSPMDPCLFVLANDTNYVHGAIGVHVDDGLCAGDAVFAEALDKLEQRFPFGSKRCGDFVFTGIHVHQDEHFNIHLDQQEYVQNIEPIKIERHRRKLEQTEVDETEKQNLRGLIGSLQYAATNTRPDVSARLSLLQSRINCAKIIDLLEANRLLGDAKKHSNVKVTISSIPEDKIRLVTYSDASFATREKQQSQKGSLLLATHEDIFHQKVATASVLSWSSKKIDRVVASTLAAETFALSHAVDALNWLRLGWEWIRNPKVPWQKPEEVWRSIPPGIAVVDCKSLYDIITKTTTPQCQEHRTLLEALVIKDHLNSGVHAHWVHSAAQLADSLTKSMDNFRLREFLSHRSCCLHDIDEVLKERSNRKAQKTWLSNTIQEKANPQGPLG